MKYKVGDMVLIRDDLMIDYYYGGCYFNHYMINFKNKLATITFVYGVGVDTRYSINLDDGICNWTDEMFSGKLIGNKILKG